MKKWNITEFNEAIQLLISGLTYNEIGVKIGRTGKGVKSALERCGYKFSDFHWIKEVRNCEECKIEFYAIPSSEKKFCSSSCSITNSNKNRIKISKCLECDQDIKYKNKFCNNTCQQLYQRKKIYQKIEDGTYAAVDLRICKKYLIEINGEKCVECGWKEKNEFSKTIPLEVHHVDCNPDNNQINNLKLLCPNCHALTKNWKAIKSSEGVKSKRRQIRREIYNNGKK